MIDGVVLTLVRGAPPEEVLELRRHVLRDGQPVETARFPGDDAPATRHVIARVGEGVVGVGTVLAEELDHAARWRVRGMAVAPAWRGRGLGSEILEELIGVVPPAGERYWCRARIRASSLYARHGFCIEGAPYDIPGVGPHVTMVRR